MSKATKSENQKAVVPSESSDPKSKNRHRRLQQAAAATIRLKVDGSNLLQWYTYWDALIVTQCSHYVGFFQHGTPTKAQQEVSPQEAADILYDMYPHYMMLHDQDKLEALADAKAMYSKRWSQVYKHRDIVRTQANTAFILLQNSLSKELHAAISCLPAFQPLWHARDKDPVALWDLVMAKVCGMDPNDTPFFEDLIRQFYLLRQLESESHVTYGMRLAFHMKMIQRAHSAGILPSISSRPSFPSPSVTNIGIVAPPTIPSPSPTPPTVSPTLTHPSDPSDPPTPSQAPAHAANADIRTGRTDEGLLRAFPQAQAAAPSGVQDTLRLELQGRELALNIVPRPSSAIASPITMVIAVRHFVSTLLPRYDAFRTYLNEQVISFRKGRLPQDPTPTTFDEAFDLISSYSAAFGRDLNKVSKSTSHSGSVFWGATRQGDVVRSDKEKADQRAAWEDIKAKAAKVDALEAEVAKLKLALEKPAPKSAIKFSDKATKPSRQHQRRPSPPPAKPTPATQSAPARNMWTNIAEYSESDSASDSGTEEGSINLLHGSIPLLGTIGLTRGLSKAAVGFDGGASHCVSNYPRLNTRPAPHALSVTGIVGAPPVLSTQVTTLPVLEIDMHYNEDFTFSVVSQTVLRDLQYNIVYDYAGDFYMVSHPTTGASLVFSRHGAHYIYDPVSDTGVINSLLSDVFPMPNPTISIPLPTISPSDLIPPVPSSQVPILAPPPVSDQLPPVDTPILMTKREREKVAKVLELSRNFGQTTLASLERLISGHYMPEVTRSDIQNAIAEQGRGPGLKGYGRKGRNTLSLLSADLGMRQEQIAHADTLFLFSEVFLLGIYEPLGLIVVSHLSSKSIADIADAIDHQFRSLASYRLTVAVLNAGEEFDFDAVKEVCARYGTIFNPSGTGNHVAAVEAAIKRIKTTARIITNGLDIPLFQALAPFLVLYVSVVLNMVPRKGIDLDGLSPRSRLVGRRYDLSKWKGRFGDVVESTSSKKHIPDYASRTDTLILLLPKMNAEDTWYCWDIINRCPCQRTWFVRVPPSTLVRKMLLDISADPSMPIASLADLGPVTQTDAFRDAAPTFWRRPPQDLLPQGLEIAYDPSRIKTAKKKTPLRSPAAVNHLLLGSPDDPPTSAFIFAMSTKKAMLLDKDKTQASIDAEIQQIIDLDTLHPTRPSPEVRSNSVHSHLTHVHKEDALTGDTSEMKTRLVVNGNESYSPAVEDTSSPTVTLHALLILSSYAAYYNLPVSTYDVKGAFLHAFMPADRPVYIYVSPQIATHFIAKKPEWSPFLTCSGGFYARLNRALYGSKEASILWYDLVSNLLLDNGFTKNVYDPCVFHHRERDIWVLLYVDDFKCINDSNKFVLHLLQTEFGSVKSNFGEVHKYLGMVFDYSATGKVQVSQLPMIDRILMENDITSSSPSPADRSLFDVDPDAAPLDAIDARTFHSVVATLIYLAKRSRPDISLTVSVLNGRVSSPTTQDLLKLRRLLRYLYGTRLLFLVLVFGRPVALIDTSWMIDPVLGRDRHSLVITLAGGTILFITKFGSGVTRSSAEAELVGFSELTTYVLMIQNFFDSINLNVHPFDIKHDNKSTIFMITKGRPTAKTRHITNRHFFISSKVHDGCIRIIHTKAEFMIADIGTKPLQGRLFSYFRDTLLNCSQF